MSKFLLDDKDFESTKVGVPKSEKSFEIHKADKDEYILLEHHGDNVGEIYSFTKSELKMLWKMLTI